MRRLIGFQPSLAVLTAVLLCLATGPLAAQVAPSANQPRSVAKPECAHETEIREIEKSEKDKTADFEAWIKLCALAGDVTVDVDLLARLAAYVERWKGPRSPELLQQLALLAIIENNTGRYEQAVLNVERVLGLIARREDAIGLGWRLYNFSRILQLLRENPARLASLPTEGRDARLTKIDRRILTLLPCCSHEVVVALKAVNRPLERHLREALDRVKATEESRDHNTALRAAANALELFEHASPGVAWGVGDLRNAINELHRSIADAKRTKSTAENLKWAKALYRRGHEVQERLLANAVKDAEARNLPAQLVRLTRQAAIERLAELYEGDALDIGSKPPDLKSHLPKNAGADRSQLVKAVPLRRRVLSLIQADTHHTTSEAVAAMTSLARVMDGASAAFDQEAEAILLQALALQERLAKSDIDPLLVELVGFYRRNRRFDDALAVGKRRLDLLDDSPPKSKHDRSAVLLDVAAVAAAAGDTNLAAELEAQRKKTDDEGALRQLGELMEVLTRAEAKFGPKAPELMEPLQDIVQHYSASEPELSKRDKMPFLERIAAIHESVSGVDSEELAEALSELGSHYRQIAEVDKAVTVYRKSVAIMEKRKSTPTLKLAESLKSLAEALIERNKHTEALQIERRAIAVVEEKDGPDAPALLPVLDALARHLGNIGRRGEQIVVLTQLLKLVERMSPDEADTAAHVSIDGVLERLANAYLDLGNGSEAIGVATRAFDLATKEYGEDHHRLSNTLSKLARAYRLAGRLDDAKAANEQILQVMRRALDEKTVEGGGWLSFSTADGFRNTSTGRALAELALIAEMKGETAEALRLYGDAESALDGGGGLDGIDARIETIVSYAQLLGRTGKSDMAVRLLRKLAPSGNAQPEVKAIFDAQVAQFRLNDREWRTSADLFRSSMEAARSSPSADFSKQFAELFGGSGWRWSTTGGMPLAPGVEARGYIRAVWRALGERPLGLSNGELSAVFQAAGAVNSSLAGSAIDKMAERAASGNAELTALVRERQDLEAEIAFIGAGHERALKAGGANDKDGERVATRSEAIDRRLLEIDRVIAEKFPQFAEITRAQQLELSEAQALLKPDEVLLQVLQFSALTSVPADVFVLAVTDRDARFVRSDMSPTAVNEQVAVLRCGLDYPMAWRRAGSACRELTGINYTDADHKAGKALPFDAGRAHALYTSLFGEIEDLIKDKHLLIVPSGPLTTLPFQVLVTARPMAGGTTDFRKVAWLARSNAITVLPAVSSLKALRRDAKPSRATQPFIGYGNPLLSGTVGCKAGTVPETCPGERIELAAGPAGVPRSAGELRSAPAYFRDGRADVAALTKLCPLPDTAHELKCVARSLEAGQDSVMLGKDMTEAALKKAPLERYRILHFATHGLLSGEMASFSEARAEPALVMTPPEHATDQDDGLLTASEVAGLRLDADWVVMSACNTAAGDQGAEALSGLARAFFYAGARALLVSHWPVNSYAATLLTSSTFAEMRRKDKAGNTIGRSQALRRAMLDLIDDTASSWAAHPSVWAPFVVVGEGGARAPN